MHYMPYMIDSMDRIYPLICMTISCILANIDETFLK